MQRPNNTTNPESHTTAAVQCRACGTYVIGPFQAHRCVVESSQEPMRIDPLSVREIGLMAVIAKWRGDARDHTEAAMDATDPMDRTTHTAFAMAFTECADELDMIRRAGR